MSKRLPEVTALLNSCRQELLQCLTVSNDLLPAAYRHQKKNHRCLADVDLQYNRQMAKIAQEAAKEQAKIDRQNRIAEYRRQVESGAEELSYQNEEFPGLFEKQIGFGRVLCEMGLIDEEDFA